jgi:hypothetical protein
MNYRDPETGEFVWEVCRAAHEDLKTYHALGEACLADFVAAFDHEESAVRRHAFQAVEMLGAKARDAVPALIAALETPEFPMYAATALGKLGPTGHEAIPKLIEVLEDYLTAPYEHGAPGSLPVSGNAGTILQTLEAFGPSAQGAVPTVVRCLEHPAPALRVFACRALIAMERQRDVSAVAVRLLRETCSQAATGWHSEVTRLMGGLGPEARRLVPELCAMLGEDDPIVRWSAAMALEEIGEHATDAVGPLIATLSDTSARVRRHCISALSNLGESAGLARSALRRCEADADREVRRLATLALSRLSAAE